MARELNFEILRKALGEVPQNLFSPFPVSISPRDAARMGEVISLIEKVIGTPGYREEVLPGAPGIAGFDPKNPGVFFGYDFHIGENGPKLIEINTNAGGAYLNVLLARAWGVEGDLEDEFLSMFRKEWVLAGRNGTPSSIAIVDDDCESQYLYSEFVLFRNLFERSGIRAVIAEAKDLEYREGRLWHADLAIDLVYNRLTDFSLGEESHRAVRDAYLEGAVVLTPHPRAHALHADKRNLALLCDPAKLAGFGLDVDAAEILSGGVAMTRIVAKEDPESLWRERKKLFFKPATGHAAKAVYRGDKVTKRVWEEIVSGPYVAQEYVPPVEVGAILSGKPVTLKCDYRNFAYLGKVQLLAARLYQGQTTNFRTEGGGFAPVFSTTQFNSSLSTVPSQKSPG